MRTDDRISRKSPASNVATNRLSASIYRCESSIPSSPKMQQMLAEHRALHAAKNTPVGVLEEPVS